MRPGIRKHHDYGAGDFGSQVRSRDQGCRLSAVLDGTEGAHLVQVTDLDWFHANRMKIYCGLKQNIDDPANGLRMRSDLHTTFDKGAFAIVPKNSWFVVHLITQTKSSPHFSALWHNTQTHPLVGISLELLFARFGWAVFFSRGYITDDRPEPLLIKTLVRNGNASEITEDYLPSQGGRSGSGSRATHSTSRRRKRIDELKEDLEYAEDEDGPMGDEPRGRSIIPKYLGPPAAWSTAYEPAAALSLRQAGQENVSLGQAGQGNVSPRKGNVSPRKEENIPPRREFGIASHPNVGDHMR
jgi:hypothetical protein